MVEVGRVRQLVFDDGTPVRAASGIAAFADGWVVVQDDATHVAWWRGDSVVPLRVFPPVAGYDTFSKAAGTKRLKPDLESACRIPGDAGSGVLLLGSGSLPARMRGAMLASPHGGAPHVRTRELAGLYATVAATLGIELTELNLEGACVVGDALRWFQRGLARQEVPSASVDVDLAGLLEVLGGDRDPSSVAVDAPRVLDLGSVGGHALAVTDAVGLVDDWLLVAAAAEDTPDPVADGPVAAAALLVLDGRGTVVVRAELPRGEDGRAWKVEGLAVRAVSRVDGQLEVEVVAVADQDDAAAASPVLDLRLRVPRGPGPVSS